VEPDIDKTLLDQRQILLQGSVDDKAQERITRLIFYLNAQEAKSPVKLLIDSMGGSCTPGGYICDMIRTSAVPVHGIVIGVCGSAAFDILQVCQKRIAHQNSHVLFHSRRLTDFRIQQNRKVMIELLDKYRLQDEQALKLLAKRSGQSLRRLKKWAEEEKKFTAVEALKLGFLDEII
jgi:ATP-dependent Clp protease protease subunit